VRTDTLIKTLHFDSETGMPQYDPIVKDLLNLQTAISSWSSSGDGRSDSCYPVGTAKEITDMALDPELSAPFLPARHDLMTWLNLDTHQPITFLPLVAVPTSSSSMWGSSVSTSPVPARDLNFPGR